MCWSKNISLSMAVIGAVFAYYSYKYINKLWGISMAFFTIMQIIHYVGYIYMAYTNYIHVCFQPFFFLLGFYGLFKMYKIITKKQLDNLYFILKLTIIVGFFSLSRLFPIHIPGYTFELEENDCVWCGKTCTFTGNRHVSFSIPLRNKPYYFTPNHYSHFMFYFIIFFLFNFKTSVFSFIMAIVSFTPLIIYNTPAAEGATLWCGISIIQLMICLIYMFVLKKK